MLDEGIKFLADLGGELHRIIQPIIIFLATLLWIVALALVAWFLFLLVGTHVVFVFAV